MTYDFHRNTIYWTTLNIVNQLSLNGGNNVSEEVRNGLAQPHSLVVDYIGRRLYWVEDDTVRDCYQVIPVLIWCVTHS